MILLVLSLTVLLLVFQDHIFKLMKSDSYSRYIRSDMYKDFLSGTRKKVRLLLPSITSNFTFKHTWLYILDIATHSCCCRPFWHLIFTSVPSKCTCALFIIQTFICFYCYFVMFFSLPEHKVFYTSYYECLMFIVCQASSSYILVHLFP